MTQETEILLELKSQIGELKGVINGLKEESERRLGVLEELVSKGKRESRSEIMAIISCICAVIGTLASITAISNVINQGRFL